MFKEQLLKEFLTACAGQKNIKSNFQDKDQLTNDLFVYEVIDNINGFYYRLAVNNDTEQYYIQKYFNRKVIAMSFINKDEYLRYIKIFNQEHDV